MPLDSERSVGDLADALDAAYPNASQHLNVTRVRAWSSRAAMGRRSIYRLVCPQITHACDIVRDVLRAKLTDAAATAA
jgi:hypothetical protein